MNYNTVGMRERVAKGLNLNLFWFLLLLCNCPHESCCSSLNHLSGSKGMVAKVEDALLPQISPAATAEPLLPLLAPSPLTPFTNSTVPKLSGLCMLDFDAVESMMGMTSIDCFTVFAPYLANVVCCPQLEATLVILIGQSSKKTNMLALNKTLANHCLSDFEQILVGQGANNNLQKICSVRPSNLTEASCPVKDVNEFERTVDTSKLLAACGKIDLVNECCQQVCQNSISEAAKNLAQKAYDLSSMGGPQPLSDHSARVDDCKSVVLRWLASKLDPSHAKEVLRGLANCNINKVCPLVLPNVSPVTRGCGDGVSDQISCCSAMESYISHLQKQSFLTNLQALKCATLLGRKLQKENITNNIYNLCHVSLKDFSLQVNGMQGAESGCLLPSLPSDATYDTSGVGFVCDLNDHIPAPWPSTSQLPTSSCNKTIKIPALPAAASGQSGLYSEDCIFHLLFAVSMAVMILL